MKKTLRQFIKIAMFIIFQNAHAQNSMPEIQIEDLTISKLENLFQNHSITCEQVARKYVNRIQKYNLSFKNGPPPINAITEINTNVFEEARALDQKYSTGHLQGKIFCVPIILKDNIDTFDTHSSSGSLSLIGNQPLQDADLVAKLRKEGALILAKSSMDELANGVSGMSSRNGRIGNVYNTNENPGGSSGGSAASVSANFSLVAIGTDNSGSVRIPSAFQGVVGLRPSQTLISQNGIAPRGNINGTAGPIAKNVEDLALILGVMQKENKIYKFHENDLQGKYIGILNKFEKHNSYQNMPLDSKKIFDQLFLDLKSNGVNIVKDLNLKNYNMNGKLNEAHEYDEMNDYFSSFPSVRKSYEDFCQFDRNIVFKSKKDCLDFTLKLKNKLNHKTKEANEVIENNRLYIDKIMDENHLDAILLPVSTNGFATYDLKTLHTEMIAPNAGLPAITFTIGYSDSGMPIGVELIGKKFDEEKLIQIAYAYKNKVKIKKNPLMPEENRLLENLSIPEYNNVITKIGFETYEKFWKLNRSKKNPDVLTPGLFQKIFHEILL